MTLVMNQQEKLRDHIVMHGCYDRERNLEIYEKWFADGPRYLFWAVDRRYGITKMALCDVGCGPGVSLFHCTPDSYGIEIDRNSVKFANSIGLKVYMRDVLRDELADLPKVEAIWCSAVLEHVESPHVFLRKLRTLLKPDGLLALYVPTIPLVPILERLPWVRRYISGYKREDHISAFLPATLQFLCEHAGFRTVEVSPFYPGLFQILNSVPPVNRLTGRCVYVGRKIDNWERIKD